MMGSSDAAVRDERVAGALLGLAAAGYERAQRDRIRYGEQLRAILQRRDARWALTLDADVEPEALLREIRDGGGGPVPLLGRLYAGAWRQDRGRRGRRSMVGATETLASTLFAR